MEENARKRESWGSSLGFILAAAGSAIGLGNIWKFPYITGQNGGGAFVLIYLFCIAAIGLPVMLCEIVLGRRTQRNPVGAFHALCPSSSTLAHLFGMALSALGVIALLTTLSRVVRPGVADASLWQNLSGCGWGITFILVGLAVFRWSWRVVGAMGVVAGFTILSFYSVVAGWTLGYTVKSATGNLNLDLDKQPPARLASVLFDRLYALPEGKKAAPVPGLSPEAEAGRLERAKRQRLIDLLGKYTEAGAAARLTAMDNKAFRREATRRLAAIPRSELQRQLLASFGGAKNTAADPHQRHVNPKALSTSLAGACFAEFMTNPYTAVGFHLLFMIITTAIVVLGVQHGIEAASKVLMPVLVILLTVLIVRALTLPGAGAGVRFFLSPDFSKLNAESVLIALGHAFFSLSLGMGAMITYGSYVRKDQNLFLATLSITGLDTLIALMAGLAIFPAVFAEGFAPSAGPGLVFQVLPAVFHQMAFGAFWETLFFLLLFVAALTSAISLLEVVTAYFVDERKWSRRKAACVFGTVIFGVGVFCAISVGDWDRLPWLDKGIRWVYGTNRGSFFDLMDMISSNWMLPLGGLFISLFVGWVWGTKHAIEEIREGSHSFADVHLISLLAGLKDDPSHNSPVHVLTLASLWGIFIRFISPVAVMIAFLHTIGWIDIKPPPAPDPPPQAQTQAADPGQQ